jgi:ABC-type transport system substrate-binding protein
MFAVADDWQRAGIGADSVIIPRQQASDREYRNTRPAFELVRQPRDLDRFRSSEIPLPENRFTGNNRTRYRNPDFDALLDRYFVTIPLQDRYQILGQIVNTMTDQLVTLAMYYPIEPMMIGNRIKNASAPPGDLPNPTWNAFEWDVS